MKLKRFYFNKDTLIDGKLTLDEQESLHAYSVMRLKINDKIVAFCGDGNDYYCSILNINKNKCECIVNEIKENTADSKINVTLYQALLKADKLELITQKITEIGVSKLVLFESEFCVAKAKDKSNKIDRLNKISLEAVKQCGRSKTLTILGTESFDEMINDLSKYDLVIFAYEGQKTNKITEIQGDYNNVAIIIGSEGGFSEQEYSRLLSLKNVQCVTLGKRILRAETASIVASALTIENFEKY